MVKGANKNQEATVTVIAYDAMGEVIDREEYHDRYEPSLRLLEFMMRVNKDYKKVVRYTCTVAYLLLLSHLPIISSAGASIDRHRYHIATSQYDSGGNCIRDCNPFSGAREFTVTLVKDEWAEPKPPVPYAEYWDNSLNQTAQQMVAIASILQQQETVKVIREEPKTDRYGPVRPKSKFDWDALLVASGLAFLCLASLIFVLASSFRQGYKHYRKFWRQHRRLG